MANNEELFLISAPQPKGREIVTMAYASPFRYLSKYNEKLAVIGVFFYPEKYIQIWKYKKKTVFTITYVFEFFFSKESIIVSFIWILLFEYLTRLVSSHVNGRRLMLKPPYYTCFLPCKHNETCFVFLVLASWMKRSNFFFLQIFEILSKFFFKLCLKQ